MHRVRLIWVTAIAVAMLTAGMTGQSVASKMRASPSALAPLRSWDSTQIRSLDLPLAAATDLQLGQAPPQGSGRRQSSPGSGSAHRRRDEVLSNERTFTRWAYVADTAVIHRRPATDSARVVRLHWYTEDGFPEIYLLLRAHWDLRGQEWIKLRIPMRPNGRIGWVRRQDLGAFHVTHAQITVNRTRLRMYLYHYGHRVWSAPVAVGGASTPTPTGHFWIRERFKIEDSSSGYWPYAFGTSDYSTLTDWPGGGVVGIHGPYYEPWAIPGRVSHGCIRLRVSDDAWLAKHIGLGTPLRVL
jgi:L,D-transpeptidase catalytic domain